MMMLLAVIDAQHTSRWFRLIYLFIDKLKIYIYIYIAVIALLQRESKHICFEAIHEKLLIETESGESTIYIVELYIVYFQY